MIKAERAQTTQALKNITGDAPQKAHVQTEEKPVAPAAPKANETKKAAAVVAPPKSAV